jgi:hypothetical protein
VDTSPLKPFNHVEKFWRKLDEETFVWLSNKPETIKFPWQTLKARAEIHQALQSHFSLLAEFLILKMLVKDKNSW